ncbi:MAG: thiamine pyrophosphate-binding protein [Rhodospirillaceae bacterium]|nr:thiamine pyrophosphate-binding protein [Rhodospirillaceae bacterium]|tara:strand:- start:14650 stop:16344 length:1695 start_codon:yes stop_codon:yes gene_type:complete
MRNTLDGGEAIVEACRKLECKYILSSPGTEWAPVWEAMANQKQSGNSGPVLMDVWHETLAVDIAMGYTMVTGEMQMVLLHAGAGLLQGNMGIHGAFCAGIPMVVISGESMTYGEQTGFDPGAQWINNLSIVGGTTRLVEPIVKYASIAGSPYTIYESIVRAGEMAQRAPTGPTYLSVSTETLMDEWVAPENARTVPAAPRMLTAPEDIEALANSLATAKTPVVLTEAAGQDPAAYQALLDLCEMLSLPVVENIGALFANFPKGHALHQGHNFKQFWEEVDLVMVIRMRAPWYPPSDRPPNATIAFIDEDVHRTSMVYQSHQADIYLEGNVAQTLRDLAAAMQQRGIDGAKVKARLEKYSASHDSLMEKRAAEHAEARKSTPIDPVWLCACLGEVMPSGTSYVDEVTTHTGLLRQHIMWNEPQSIFSRQGGLGQGLGLAIGVKLAKPESPVVAIIGDGAFLYNPVLQSLGAARDFKLPIMTVIFNNSKYAAMQNMHLKMYPEGIAVDTDVFHGTHIQAPDFTKVAEAFGAYGERVEDPEEVQQALKNGLQALDEGRSAIIDVAIK